jgi:hypothetical protein
MKQINIFDKIVKYYMYIIAKKESPGLCAVLLFEVLETEQQSLSFKTYLINMTVE